MHQIADSDRVSYGPATWVCDQPDLPVLGVLRSARLTAGSCWRADGGAL